MKVCIEVNENQAYTIKQALDFYSRFIMGQFEEIDRLMINHSKFWEDYDSRERLGELIKEMRNIIYPQLNGYAHWGIYSINCPQESKVAYDIIQVLRHELWKNQDDRPNWTVDSANALQCGKEKLCNVTIKKEKGD